MTTGTKTITNAELLGIGTELLLGEIVDTNSAWLAQQLAERGVDVYWSRRVGDNLGRIVQGLNEALSRCDLVVTCGGLGPTDDDMTREAVARVLGETPEVDEGLEHTLRGWFERFNRDMPEKNLKQAWLIPSAEALPNPRGTAPGWLVRTERDGRDKVIVTLPGPPRELERMWHEEVVPQLRFPASGLYSKLLKTQGLGESHVAEQLGTLTEQANPSVATYAKRDGVHVRIAAKADSPEAAAAAAKPVVEDVRERLRGRIWGEDDDELAAVVLSQLEARDASLATMESLTGGMIGELITAVAGASAVYRGGVVSYTPQAKTAFGVSETLLNDYTSISEEVVKAMADAVAQQLSSDYALATTGVAGPEPSEGHEVGEVYLGLYTPDGVSATRLDLPFRDRAWVRERTSFAALALLWKHLSR